MWKPLLFVLLCAIPSTLWNEVRASRDQATVEGTVKDIHGGLVTSADIELQAGRRKYTVQTDQRGAYSIELPSGVYSMEIKHYGFCGMRRAQFFLRPSTVVYFETELRICPSDSVNSRLSYEDLAAVPNSSLHPLILFGDKQPIGSAWKYTGPLLEAIGMYPVVFTYNTLTITANYLIYDPKAQTVAASGHVVFQHGRSVQRGSKFEITLNGLDPSGRMTD